MCSFVRSSGWSPHCSCCIVMLLTCTPVSGFMDLVSVQFLVTPLFLFFSCSRLVTMPSFPPCSVVFSSLVGHLVSALHYMMID